MLLLQTYNMQGGQVDRSTGATVEYSSEYVFEFLWSNVL